MCDVLPPGSYSIAVKYIISYHIREKTEGRIKLREDEEEGLSSYWWTLRKTEDAGN